jgi:hypothetical protein
MLNTLSAVLLVLFIVVAVNSFLYFGYYLPRMTPSAPAWQPPRTERTDSSSPSTTFERTHPTTTGEETTAPNY